MRITKMIAPALLALSMLWWPNSANAGVFLSITVAPPPLPVYDQPVIPGPGYIWTPGYWSYDEDAADYYWVPGAWVLAPEPGLLWTPGYWGWSDGVYVWHDGYWGPHVGFYGGVVYGFGYTGVGFAGGYWSGGVFTYNRACTNINTTIIHNTYNKTVIVNNVTNVSYNGGTGGLKAAPTAEERLAEHEHHTLPTGLQTQHQLLASKNHDLHASANGGKPMIAAVSKAGEFSGKGIVAAKAAGDFKRTSLSHDNKGKFDQNGRHFNAGKNIVNASPNTGIHTDSLHKNRLTNLGSHGPKPNLYRPHGRPPVPVVRKTPGKPPKKPT